ncbi:hypothetical protein [Desulfomonile tiedjei]|uniref:Uncharacterized protein n=1 Tax=Desulfomonile tiedjei (strain ATCC 49306 / DSM 6799 / DCB-1) TaxID=706587 RepID=I4C6B7_DESTA|nr:hypothetical protein [Desulfomonile tiedjei]AFM25108.1 hypothetical protein Desti_2426 [Desulfomonile tiedjei DSM 6799]
MDYLAYSLIAAADFHGTEWGSLFSYWAWAFWVGSVLGFIGIAIGFFMKNDLLK